MGITIGFILNERVEEIFVWFEGQTISQNTHQINAQAHTKPTHIEHPIKQEKQIQYQSNQSFEVHFSCLPVAPVSTEADNAV